MFGLQMLDVLIGLVFIYVLLALVCTVVMEMVAGRMDMRTKNLRLGLTNLLGEDLMLTRQGRAVVATAGQEAERSPAVQQFYDHPLIKTLREDGTPPSYIPPATFALAVIDMFAPAQGGGRKVNDFTAGVNLCLEEASDLRRNLLILVDEAGGDMAKLKANLETLFNNAMERVSGWYKNKTQLPLLLFATAFCLLANVDSIRIAKGLYSDGALREALVAQAQEAVKNPRVLAGSEQDPAADLQRSVAEIKKIGIKIGWDQETWETSTEAWFTKLVGIMITALAVSLGAPFWFDILNRLVNIRAVGKSPVESKPGSPANPAQASGH